MPSLNRRDFMAAAGGWGLAGTVAALPESARATTPAAAAAFYDPRLPEARAALLRRTGLAGQPLPADLTEALALVQAQRRRQPGVAVQGVSAEALPFCLQGLMPGATLSLQRLDSDHFAWTLA